MFEECFIFMICDATASLAGSITTATLASAFGNPALGDKSSFTELYGRDWVSYKVVILL